MATDEPRIIPGAAATFADLDGPLDVAPVAADELEGRLEERSVLGRGGLGEVVECFDRDLRRIVALKRPLSDSPAARDALLREAQVTAQLVHPSVPAVHAIGITDGKPWFTMTRLRGRTLAQRLSDGLDWTLARRLRVVLGIAQALTYAHHRGVLHRDLKPDNVFVGEFGEVTVVDWGIAKVLGSADEEDSQIVAVETTVPGRTQVGQFAGTPAYAAPEQLRGQVDIDVRADVYALGALLHAVILGDPPVTGPTAESVRERVLAGQIAIPGAEDGVPAPVAAILRRALAHDREDRYASVAALAADLEAFLDKRPVQAHEDESHFAALNRWYRQTRPLTRFDVDLFIFTGGCAGGFACSVLIGLVPELRAVFVLLAALGYATAGFYAILRVAKLWHLRGNGLTDPRLLFGYGILASVLIGGIYTTFHL